MDGAVDEGGPVARPAAARGRALVRRCRHHQACPPFVRCDPVVMAVTAGAETVFTRLSGCQLPSSGPASRRVSHRAPDAGGPRVTDRRTGQLLGARGGGRRPDRPRRRSEERRRHWSPRSRGTGRGLAPEGGPRPPTRRSSTVDVHLFRALRIVGHHRPGTPGEPVVLVLRCRAIRSRSACGHHPPDGRPPSTGSRDPQPSPQTSRRHPQSSRSSAHRHPQMRRDVRRVVMTTRAQSSPSRS